MGKIKSRKDEIFTTTDGQDFTNMDKAKRHQMDLSEKELSPELEKFLNEMFDLPTHDEINDLYDSEKDGDYAKGEKLEEKMDDFLSDQCGNMGWVDDMEDLTKHLIGVYQAFGIEKLSDIFMFIDNKMNM